MPDFQTLIDAFAGELSVVKLRYIYEVPRVWAARTALLGAWEAQEKHIEILRSEISSLKASITRFRRGQATDEDYFGDYLTND